VTRCNRRRAQSTSSKLYKTHLALDLQVLQRLLRHLVVQGDASGLDGDATVLLVLPRIRQTGIAGLKVHSFPQDAVTVIVPFEGF
jgi:hypothetical protein